MTGGGRDLKRRGSTAHAYLVFFMKGVVTPICLCSVVCIYSVNTAEEEDFNLSLN